MTSYIGIDIGGTKIAGAIVSDSAGVSMRQSLPTPAKEGGKAILAEAVSLAGKLLQDADLAGVQISGIGVGAGGQIDANLGLVYSATEVLPGWKGTRLTEAFERSCKLPCRADNDVNVLALGECRFGAARHLATTGRGATVVFLALGTGVGGALIQSGRVHHGAHWSGGEFGHILLSVADGTAQMRYRLAPAHTGSMRRTRPVATYRELAGDARAECAGEDVVAAAEKEKDVGPAGWAGTESYYPDRALSGFWPDPGQRTDPDLIIIGGGLSALGEALLEPARAVLHERALPGPSTCPVVVAQLHSDAAIEGAGCLMIKSGD